MSRQKALTPRRWWKLAGWGCLGTVVVAVVSFGGFVVWVKHDIQTTRASIRQLARTGSCVGCDLSYANLSGLDLQFVDLSGANLRRADLRGTVLGAATLVGTDFTRADLSGAVLRQASLDDAIFDRANLTGADFHCGAGTCTTLQGASFRQANLTRANLVCLDCFPEGERVGLAAVDLRGANLTEADLQYSRLDGAKIEGAVFCRTTLADGKVAEPDCKASTSTQ